MRNVKYLLVGILFGITLTKGRVISWFTIQDMFHFRSFHMYGVLMSAIATAIFGIFVVRRIFQTSITGESISIPDKKYSHGVIIGGIIFGLGWALTGACPGPIYAQIGTGATVSIVTLLSALAGTWVYCALRPKLPH